MKNLCLLVFTLFSLSILAQDIPTHALGLRLGSNNGFGSEINYQLRITPQNRIEFGLGWRSKDDNNRFKALAIYEWVNALSNNLNWYYGVGGGVAAIDYDADAAGNPEDKTFVKGAGNIGLEYLFAIPLQLTLDFRPELNFLDGDRLDFDIAFGVRYTF